ncbi:hypothetical protein pdam_00005207 [Pocillopora damicornis]|uniref:Uncharacterized protein n=1 Tax=Pocillopora damicornis TaxID=46731 RepID=A0A3M6T4X2_POCDA|nr:hypothetical protein pdam_00005207 [Pocillopora damicornis]
MWGEVVVAGGSTRRDELATERNLDKTRFNNLRESQYRNLAVSSGRRVLYKCDKNKEKYYKGDYQLIQYQILGTNIIRIVWHTVWQVTDKIYGEKRSSLHFITYLSTSSSPKENVDFYLIPSIVVTAINPCLDSVSSDSSSSANHT